MKSFSVLYRLASRLRRSAAGLCVLAAVVWIGCEAPAPPADSSKDKSAAAKDEMGAGSTIEGFRMRVFEGNALANLLQADRASLNLQTHETLLEDVTVQFLTSGTETGRFESSEGILFLEDRPKEGIASKDFELRGGVDVAWEGMSARAPSLRYSSANPKAAYTSGGSSFTLQMRVPGGTLVCSGERFEASADLDKMQFSNNVKMQMDQSPTDTPNRAGDQGGQGS